MKIFIYASEIAGFIGQNTYDYTTCFQRLWSKVDQENYNLIINKNKDTLLKAKCELENIKIEKNTLDNDLETKKITKRQHTLKMNKLSETENIKKNESEKLETKIDNISLNQSERIQKVLGADSVVLIQNKTMDTETKRVNIIEQISLLDISKEKKKVLLNETESFINKTHGTLKEDSAIDMFEKKFKVKLDTTQEFFKKEIMTIGENSYLIGGKLDGIYKNEYIVEVKNRTKGFFQQLRDYEKTQIHLYMYMLDINKAKLVEKFGNKLRITEIYFDNDYMEDILIYLGIFIKNFEVFLSNNTLKEEFVACDTENKKKFIRNLYLNEINKKTQEKILDQLVSDSESEGCLIEDDL